MRILPISMEEVREIAHNLAQAYMEWGEPIPEFSTRFPNVLERCVEAPFQTYEGPLYKGLIEKSSILFYLMIKNHPFQNGNKRIAVMTLLYFLHKNGFWIKVDNQRLYNFAKWVAESDSSLSGATILAIQKFVSDNKILLRPK